MARKIDPMLAEILKAYECDPQADIWDCHGTWVAYHRTLEKIAAKAGISFAPPTIVENDSAAGIVALCVTGTMADRSEWSFGEASPKNNKNAYPYSMAEKRAKDRVIIKLVGLHGVYSEDEADDFKESKPAPKAEADTPFDGDEPSGESPVVTALIRNAWAQATREKLDAWYQSQKTAIRELPDNDRAKVATALQQAGARFKKAA